MRLPGESANEVEHHRPDRRVPHPITNRHYVLTGHLVARNARYRDWPGQLTTIFRCPPSHRRQRERCPRRELRSRMAGAAGSLRRESRRLSRVVSPRPASPAHARNGPPRLDRSGRGARLWRASRRGDTYKQSVSRETANRSVSRCPRGRHSHPRETANKSLSASEHASPDPHHGIHRTRITAHVSRGRAICSNGFTCNADVRWNVRLQDRCRGASDLALVTDHTWSLPPNSRHVSEPTSTVGCRQAHLPRFPAAAAR